MNRRPFRGPWPGCITALPVGVLLASVALADPVTGPLPPSVMAGADTFLEGLPAADAPVAFEGRYARGRDGEVELAYPGVTAHLRFRGTSLALHASASNGGSSFDVIVDGGTPSVLRLEAGDGTYVVYRGTAGEHRVELVRRNESWRGTCALLDFAPDPNGALLDPPTLPGRRLLFIGDSVTCGELSAWRPGDDPKDGSHSDARESYGMILARRLAAQCALVSYGGRGLIRDWQGIRATNNAPQFYDLSLPDDPSSRWDHQLYVPDAVGIQLGTNDFNLGPPDEAEFVNAYVGLIRKVLRDAPEAYVFVMDSPIVDDDATKGPRRTILHGYLEAVVAQAASPKVILAPLRHYPGVPGNGHPTGADHVGIADELEPVFREALGW